MPEALQPAQDVADNLVARYGTPSKVYVVLVGWGYDYYLAPEAEAPYIVADAAAFAAMKGNNNFLVILVIDNILYKLDVSLPEYRDGRYQNGSYTIRIGYLSRPVGTGDFSAVSHGDQYEADVTEPFPLLHGEIPYIVIDP